MTSEEMACLELECEARHLKSVAKVHGEFEKSSPDVSRALGLIDDDIDDYYETQSATESEAEGELTQEEFEVLRKAKIAELRAGGIPAVAMGPRGIDFGLNEPFGPLVDFRNARKERRKKARKMRKSKRR